MIVVPPKELTDADLYDVLISYDHSYGLVLDDELAKGHPLFSGYTQKEREKLKNQLREFYRLIKRRLQEKYRFQGGHEVVEEHNNELKRNKTPYCLMGYLSEYGVIDE